MDYEFKVFRIMSLRQSDFKGYYSILGMYPLMNHEEIKLFLDAHYKKMVLLYHPDKNPQSDVLIKRLNEAREIFKDDSLYRDYQAKCWLKAMDLAL